MSSFLITISIIVLMRQEGGGEEERKDSGNSLAATRRAAWGSPISPGTETIGRKSEGKIYTALIGGLLVISFH